MNYSYTSIAPVPIIYIMKNNDPNLTDIGIFASTILLSLSGLIAIIASSCRNSRCKDIDLCGLKLHRENINNV